jgi:hypothetical protein
VRGRIAAALFAATLCFATSSSAASGRFWGPMLALPRSARASFSCILWHESRSTFQHLNLGDNNRYGSSGIFQIEQQLWAARSGFRVPVWKATPYQQELGAIRIWRVDGFHPWYSDGCF